MTDRELLEMAAKATGLTGYIHEWINGPEFVVPGADPITWRPLTDDGDALRLAVSLRITPHIYSSMTDCKDCTEVHLCDPYAATRRVIVRAAAEIGKAMP